MNGFGFVLFVLFVVGFQPYAMHHAHADRT